MENQRLSHIFGLSKQLIISPILETKAGGVVYGALDDERFDYTHSTILRVSAATTAQKKAAISFMHGQLGKQYDAGFGLFTKNRLSSRKDWYCSILVWAAYMNATPDGRIDELTDKSNPNFQGIDLETKQLVNEPGVNPNDIFRSPKVEKINPFFVDYKDYAENIRWSNTGTPTDDKDFIFSRGSNSYTLRNDYHFIATDKNNGRPYASTRLTFGRKHSGTIIVEFDMFTRFLLTDEARAKFSDRNIPLIPKTIEDSDVPNHVMNWINTYTQCSLEIVYSNNISTDNNHLRYNPSFTKITKKKHPVNPYHINQVVHTPPAFTQQRFDYTENLSIYDKYEMTRPNPFNADVSYNRATPSWYYFYNNFYVLVKLENGTYRYAVYLRFHGSFTTAASVRNGYGFNHDFTMTDEAKAIYGNYFYRIGVNQSVDYAIDWLNRYTKENTLIVYSTNIDNDVRKLNDGTATVRKAVNDQGKFVYCIL
ncbi:YiiX/YebB-like N1pC/P60 family cysteine hydrolase [Enterococcus faecium]|uniref:YiiX/YebB-like N1pC/P60 family cysteine hydrolase n=1 Tax=Enterococcus faecium TaxID=1352 RepID=UPI002221FFEE|nr:YiiX/YebB-like N1pC/P60 family cysteine hydrolase [Enterococcus faecium]MCW1817737.1 YiiX/YebB-like N1pC/P60 family cysteine hydrolase [Enterococcus faecium]